MGNAGCSSIGMVRTHWGCRQCHGAYRAGWRCGMITLRASDLIIVLAAFAVLTAWLSTGAW
jgi:hypothetical protein